MCLSLIMLLITLKSRSSRASIGWMLKLLTHKAGAVAADKECLVREQNWFMSLKPIHLWRLSKQVNNVDGIGTGRPNCTTRTHAWLQV